MKTKLIFRNDFFVEHYKEGVLLARQEFSNAVTTGGKNHMLNEYFRHSGYSADAIATWYIGLIDNAGSPTLADADTLASKSWTEFTNYTGNRQAWAPLAASLAAKGTETVSTFVIGASATIYGAFLASVATGTSGILFSTGNFTAPIAVQSPDEIKVGYTIRLT